MVKRASNSGRTKLFGVASLTCLISLALAHSRPGSTPIQR